MLSWKLLKFSRHHSPASSSEDRFFSFLVFLPVFNLLCYYMGDNYEGLVSRYLEQDQKHCGFFKCALPSHFEESQVYNGHFGKARNCHIYSYLAHLLYSSVISAFLIFFFFLLLVGLVLLFSCGFTFAISPILDANPKKGGDYQ